MYLFLEYVDWRFSDEHLQDCAGLLIYRCIHSWNMRVDVVFQMDIYKTVGVYFFTDAFIPGI